MSSRSESEPYFKNESEAKKKTGQIELGALDSDQPYSADKKMMGNGLEASPLNGGIEPDVKI